MREYVTLPFRAERKRLTTWGGIIKEISDETEQSIVMTSRIVEIVHRGPSESIVRLETPNSTYTRVCLLSADAVLRLIDPLS